ncbi:MAG: MotA/TolQ/ExbB proton channel family protein [Opitutales bacterium]
MKRYLFPILAVLATLLPAGAQSIASAKNQVDAELKAALDELAGLRAEIREEKIPLAKRLNEVEAEAQTKRRQVERALRAKDSSTRSLIDLQNEIEAVEESITFMNNQLNDFARKFQATINIAEKQLYEEEIDAVIENIEDSEMSDEEKFEKQFGLVSTALERVEDVLSGKTFTGKAIVPGGTEKTGTLILFGPSSYFASSESPVAGIIDPKQPLRPRVLVLGENEAGIRAVAEEGTGSLPFDPTLNDAFELEVNETTLWDEIKAGGVWIWPIIVFFVLSILTAIFKFFEIYAVKTPSDNVLQQVLTYINDGQKDEAMKYVKKVPGPFGRLLQDAVAYSGEDKELIEEVLYERMLETQPTLERLLPFIAVTAATAPLLGLLGTVTGMINTFQQITLFGTSDASKLAGGISEALVTTKFGLIAAIPALILHALLSRKAQGVLAAMEKFSAGFVNGLSTAKK